MGTSAPASQRVRTAPAIWWGTLIVVALLVASVGACAVLASLPAPGLVRIRHLAWYHLRARLTPAALATGTIRLPVPFHRQEHALSCEIAALTMLLNYVGVHVSEAELLAQLPFATTGPRSRDNVWGDPDVGFVGNIDGKIPNSGYGVYEAPLVTVAQRYRPARVLTGASLSGLLETVAGGRPVLVWGSLASGRDISWITPAGKPVKAVFGEHTRVVVGFSGPPARPKSIFLLDPIYGPMTMSPKQFLVNWELLDRKAVVVE